VDNLHHRLVLLAKLVEIVLDVALGLFHSPDVDDEAIDVTLQQLVLFGGELQLVLRSSQLFVHNPVDPKEFFIFARLLLEFPLRMFQASLQVHRRLRKVGLLLQQHADTQLLLVDAVVHLPVLPHQNA